jgi:hypothetical protein
MAIALTILVQKNLCNCRIEGLPKACSWPFSATSHDFLNSSSKDCHDLQSYRRVSRTCWSVRRMTASAALPPLGLDGRQQTDCSHSVAERSCLVNRVNHTLHVCRKLLPVFIKAFHAYMIFRVCALIRRKSSSFFCSLTYAGCTLCCCAISLMLFEDPDASSPTLP